MVSAAEKSKVLDRSVELLQSNRRKTPTGEYYTVPSPQTYPYQWLWDSCFHAIVLAATEPEIAKSEIRALLSKQLGSGMVPHMIYWERVEGVIDIPWGYVDTSSLTQPPLIPEAVARIYAADADRNFLAEVFPKMALFFEYLLRERDPRGNHLIGIVNPDESGEDDSPRFDLPLDLPPQQTFDVNFARRLRLVDQHRDCNCDAPFCTKQVFWVKDVPYNAIAVRNLRILASLGDVLGEVEEAAKFRKHADYIAQAMRLRMEADGNWFSTMGESYQKITVTTWARFAPLYAGILTSTEAKELITSVFYDTESFGTPFGVPTVPRNEISYDPAGMWRGPVWTGVNWLLYHSFTEYGFHTEADRIREMTFALLSQSGFRERFNPETGEGLGAENFTWGALVCDMLPPQNPLPVLQKPRF